MGFNSGFKGLRLQKHCIWRLHIFTFLSSIVSIDLPYFQLILTEGRAGILLEPSQFCNFMFCCNKSSGIHYTQFSFVCLFISLFPPAFLPFFSSFSVLEDSQQTVRQRKVCHLTYDWLHDNKETACN